MTPLLQEIAHWLGRIAVDTAVLLAVFGLLGKRWLDGRLEKHNKEMARLQGEIENSRRLLQAEIDKTILVTKVHFETEFEAYKAVFQKLAEMRFQFSELRPSMSIVPANDTKDARRTRLNAVVKNAQQAYNELITTSENLSPFYAPEIYLQIVECQRISQLEINDILVLSEDEFTLQWFGRGKQNLEKFMTAYTNVSTLIRDRISKLTVVAK
jgi:hypothetical protein